MMSSLRGFLSFYRYGRVRFHDGHVLGYTILHLVLELFESLAMLDNICLKLIECLPILGHDRLVIIM